ncbi:Phosphopantetheine attachment site [Streptomyces sp. yr375]|uniref:phosphopantetheine-binding protein n=1 Tax=Streptomyces sp. yr375 TaxID=1761906 RepID=UPI0008B534CE|nr:phosphopantetheine-binding protein [Streptomyces sp. yr375]SES10951.1 Phosphopantetheine attachment site [Streptomyces sp. yr375]
MDHVSHGNPPGNETAAVVAEIWCEVLEVPEVGDGDNFFDLGGHSLLLQMVRERVVQRLGKEVELIEFFTHPTVRSFAHHLDHGGAAETGNSRRRPTGRVNRLGNRRAQLDANTPRGRGEFE